ncbi:unnamed protein product [Heterobilharzia americana]|nr:unnamed protein product [Heterobilharzia americana]CAH8605147.1 unnamed protein product [Heterobilharzia americana]
MRGKRMHKGRTRKFTAPEEIDRQLGLSRGVDNAGEAGSSLNESRGSNVDNLESNDESDDDDGEDEDATGRHKGVSHLIEVCNPNHVKGSVVPSRKEIAASAKAIADPLKLQSETELAINLARLQLVRKERELAAQKLEEEKQAREAQRAAAAQRAAEAKAQLAKQQKAGRSAGKQAISSAKSKQTVTSKDSNTTVPTKSGSSVD